MTKISVLLPSRGRFDALLRTLRAFAVLTAEKRALEVLVKADHCDQQMQERSHELDDFYFVKVIWSPRGRGYVDMHKFNNMLAAYAEGDWLLLFNDDAWIDTENWDQYIRFTETLNQPVLYFPFVKLPEGVHWDDYHKTRHHDFPLLNRRLYEALGHISVTTCCDRYLWDVCQPCGIVKYKDDVVIRHAYTRDETHPFDRPERQEILDHFDSPLTKQKIQEAQQRVRAILP